MPYDRSFIEEIKNLLASGKSINDRIVILKVASYVEDIATLNKLISMGFDINQKGKYSKPLWFEFVPSINLYEPDEDELRELFQPLLELDEIDLAATDQDGNNVIHEMEFYEDSNETVWSALELLINKGVDVNHKNDQGKTPLFYMLPVLRGTKMLVEAGADVHATDNAGRNVLLAFCHENEKSNCLDVLEFLLAHGANINQATPVKGHGNGGWMPLHMAIFCGNETIARALVDRGADINAQKENGQTPLRMAYEKGMTKLISYLEELGAEPGDPESLQHAKIEYLQKKHQWDACIDKINEAIDQGWETKELYHVASHCYRWKGDFQSAIDWIKKGYEKFGYYEYYLDAITFYYCATGTTDQAIEFWIKNKEYFDPQAEPSRSIVGNLLHAYAAESRADEGLQILEPYFDRLNTRQEAKKGGCFYNISCLYGLTGQVENSVRWAIEALQFDVYTLEQFKDSDFDNVRNHPLFVDFINHFENHGRTFHYYEKDASDYVMIWTNAKMRGEIIRCKDGKYSNEKLDLSAFELLKANYQLKQNLLEQGYQEAFCPLYAEWQDALESLFEMMADYKRENDIDFEEIYIEWNYLYDNDDGDHPLLRTYYAYADNGFQIDDFDCYLQIPSKVYFSNIVEEAKKLEAFRQLNCPQITFIHSEHDAGDEFKLV